jgi:hypothetical protein
MTAASGAKGRSTTDMLLEHSRAIVAVEGSVARLEKDFVDIRHSQEAITGKLDRLITEAAKHPHSSFKEVATTLAACCGVLAVLAGFVMWFVNIVAEPLKGQQTLAETRLRYELQLRDMQIAQLHGARKTTRRGRGAGED